LERYSDELARLITILKDELRLCDEFEQVLREERKYLERFRPSEMERVSARKLALRDRFATLEKTRIDVLKVILAKAGMTEEGITLSRLFDLFPHTSKELKVIGTTLLNNLEKLKNLNAINQKIVNRTLHHLRATTGFMNLMMGQGEQSHGRLLSRAV